jgi:hypothetical protein
LPRSLRTYVAFVVVLALGACNPDPTSGGFSFAIENDTNGTVIVGYCDNASCSKRNWTETVEPGKTLPVSTAAEGFDEWHRFVDSRTHVVIGCKTLNFHNKRMRELVVRVSDAQCCRS